MNMDTLTNLSFLVMPFLGILFLYVLSHAYFLRLGKFPLNSFLARQPGQSTQQTLMKQRQIYFVLLFFIPLMLVLGFYTLHINQFSIAAIAVKVLLASYIFIVLMGLVLLVNCIRSMNRNALALEAAQGVAQLLSRVEKHAFCLYHDVPVAKQVFVPHIVVGQAGVFIVNLLIRERPFFYKKDTSIRARYINQRFIFPKGQNRKIIKASEDMGSILQARLAKIIGQKIPVKVILTVPGWYLEKKEKAPIIILPVAQVEAFISSFADKQHIDEFLLEKVNDCIAHLSSDS